MIKKILLVLGIIVVLFAGINTAAALNSSILDAISGLPLSDQIFFIAKEVDQLKLKDELRDACDSADALYAVPVGYDGPMTVGGSVVDQVAFLQNWVDHPFNPTSHTSDEEFAAQIKEAFDFFENRYEGYVVAKADCDRLTEEFNQKYGE